MPPKFEVNVLDFSDRMWEQTSKQIVSSAAQETLSCIYKERKMDFDPEGIFSLGYNHIDFTSVKSIQIAEVREVLLRARVVTICWALNEAEMVDEFWAEFFSLTKSALVIFIDGKSDKLAHLQEILARGQELEAGAVICEFLENPRRLIKLPSAN